MNAAVVLILTCLLCGRGEGFFSKFSSRKKSESNQIEDEFGDVCKTVRVMPRIAMAVVGGAPLKSENSAPYIAAVGERTSNGSVSWFCGGSLISPYDILTAAHCLISRNVSTVRLGSFSTKQRSTENDYEVLETIIHPRYKITESYNDVAIIKVKKKIGLDDNIKPVCLPQDGSDTYEKERAKVIGWGAEEFGGEGSQKLQQVEVEVFSNSNCEKAYRNSTIAPKTFPRGIEKEQLCAGSSKGGKDACQGDSGGPLVLTDESGIVRQIGIVSTGAGCGFKMYPGVYARVSSYIDWIRQQVKSSRSAPSRQSGISSSNEPNSQRKNDDREETLPGKPPHSTGQSSAYKKEERPTASPNLVGSHSSQKEKHDSRESSLKNEASRDGRPDGKNAHGPRNDQNPNQLSKTTTSTKRPPQSGPSSNDGPGPKHSSNRQSLEETPGSGFPSPKQTRPSPPGGAHGEENESRRRPTGADGLSSREQIPSRILQQDQLSSIQRPSPYRSP